MKTKLYKTVGIILAGGIGKRFGAKIPKQFMSLNGKLVIQYGIDALKNSGVIDYIIVVTSRGWFDYQKKLKYVDKVVGGGRQRTDSICNGLMACPSGTKYVLFHDAGRPFLKKELVTKCIRELEKGTKYVVTIDLINDALIETDKQYNVVKVLDRDKAKLCQTPEAFDYKTIMKVYEGLKGNYNTVCEPLQKMAKGKAMLTPDINLKITYPKDLFRAEQTIKYQNIIKKIPNVKDKRILLFGGSGGIGSEIKKQLKELGAIVFSPSSKEFNLNNFPKEHKLYSEIFDCIIHCAGTYARDDEGLIDNYDKIMNINFKSAVEICEIAPKHWLIKGGNIILISSTASSKGRKNISIYSASKSALNTFAEAISEQLTKYNIKVNVICPAKTATRLQSKINPKADFKKMIQPKDMAQIIIGYCDVDFTGQIAYAKVGLI